MTVINVISIGAIHLLSFFSYKLNSNSCLGRLTGSDCACKES